MPERLYSPQGAAELHEARRLSPGLFEPTADLDALLSLVVQLTEIRTGWLARRRSRLGWTLIDALESRWSDRIAELTLEIVERCRSGHPQRPEGTMPP